MYGELKVFVFLAAIPDRSCEWYPKTVYDVLGGSCRVHVCSTFFWRWIVMMSLSRALLWQDLETSAPLPDGYGALNDVTNVCAPIKGRLASFPFSGKKWGPSFIYVMVVIRSGSQSAFQFILKMFGCGWAQGSMQTGKTFFLRQKLLT